MMKRFVSALMVSVFLTQATPVFADVTLPSSPPLQPGEQPVGQAVSPMKMGQKAPFTGLLLSPEAVAKIIVDINNKLAEIDLEAKRARDTQKAEDQLQIDNLKSDLQTQKTVTDIQVKSRDATIQELTKKIEEEEKSKPNLPLWIGGGFVAGITVTVLTVFALNKATR